MCIMTYVSDICDRGVLRQICDSNMYGNRCVSRKCIEIDLRQGCISRQIFDRDVYGKRFVTRMFIKRYVR